MTNEIVENDPRTNPSQKRQECDSIFTRPKSCEYGDLSPKTRPKPKTLDKT